MKGEFFIISASFFKFLFAPDEIILTVRLAKNVCAGEFSPERNIWYGFFPSKDWFCSLKAQFFYDLLKNERNLLFFYVSSSLLVSRFYHGTLQHRIFSEYFTVFFFFVSTYYFTFYYSLH